jgi:hypothetical protein
MPKTILFTEKIGKFLGTGNLATIGIDENLPGALGDTARQSIKLILPPNFTWIKADENYFQCSGGLTGTVVRYSNGLNTRTLELSYDPIPFRSARGSIFLPGLQIKASL